MIAISGANIALHPPVILGQSRTLMSAETGKKAIDFLIEKSGSRRNLEVDFFGGEPLLNFDAVKQIVEYALETAEGRREKTSGSH